jgi:hypothetical protein
MRAMTWWDHETSSIWSQPWGRAIQGELKGVELFLLPSQVTTWGSWFDEHPETLVMVNDLEDARTDRKKFKDEFVIGLLFEGNAKAYPFSLIEETTLVNDHLGPYPILVWAEGDRYHAYLRLVDDQILNFVYDGARLIDHTTGSEWDLATGIAVDGELKAQFLIPVPASTASDWAWFNFYPDSDTYEP